MRKIKTGSDFSGVGAFDQALERLEIEQDKEFACDMDKYARQTYILNFGEPKYYPKDVYDREIPKESLDIYVTSPPCQGFSMAGKREGSILFFNSHEFIKKNKPRFFIFENVKGLLSHEGGKTFQTWYDYLGGKTINGNAVIFPHSESVPYHIYYKVINAKQHNIPQNRERIFIIGIRDDEDNSFRWAKPEHLKKRLKDVLESDVDEKYFLSDRMIKGFIKSSQKHEEKGTGFKWIPKDENDTANCLRAQGGLNKTDNSIKVGFINQDSQGSSVFDSSGTSPNICSGTHGYANGYVKIGAIRGRNPENPTSRAVGLPTQQMLEINKSGTSNSLTTVQKDNVFVFDIPQRIKVRRNKVNIKELQEELKKNKNISTSKISDSLGVKKTTVDHWFRIDEGFSIPDSEIWFDLKKLLNITTSRFDKSITEWEERDGVYEKANRVYGINEISPTITSTSAYERIITETKIRRLTPLECFRLMDFNPSFKWDVSDTQAYRQAGNSICVGVLVGIIKSLRENCNL